MKIRYKSENFWYKNVIYEKKFIVKYVESSFIVNSEMVWRFVKC